MVYTLPQTTVFQLFETLSSTAVRRLAACVVGPNYKLMRFSDADTKTLIALGAYDPTDDITFDYPTRPDGSIVDRNYVKLFADELYANYASLPASATNPLYVLSETSRNKVIAAPRIGVAERMNAGATTIANGVAFDTSGFYSNGMTPPERYYLWPTGGGLGGSYSTSKYLSVLSASDPARLKVSTTEGYSGTVDLPTDALTSGVTTLGPHGIVLDADVPASGGRVAAIMPYTGQPSSADAVTLGSTVYTVGGNWTLGSTANDTYEALKVLVESSLPTGVTEVIHIPGNTTATGTIYFIGTAGTFATATESNSVDNAVLGSIAAFNSLRAPKTIKFRNAAGTSYFTLSLKERAIPGFIDAALADTGANKAVRLLWNSAAASVTMTGGLLTANLTLASTTLSAFRALLAENTTVAAGFDISDITGTSSHAIAAVVDDTGSALTEDVACQLLPDAYRIRVYANEFVFAKGNGYEISSHFRSRGVKVGDQVRYTSTVDSVVYEGTTRVTAIDALPLGSMQGAASVDSANEPDATATDLSAGAAIITPGDDNQRAMDGANTKLFSLEDIAYPGDARNGILSDTVTVTITTGGAAGIAKATVTTASGNYRRTNVPVVAGDATEALIYCGYGLYMLLDQGVGDGDAVFQRNDTYTLSTPVLAAHTAPAATDITTSGRFIGTQDTTYVLEVLRGGTLSRGVTVLDGFSVPSADLLTAQVADFADWTPGDQDDEYVLRCTTAGTLSVARFALDSQLGDNATDLAFEDGVERATGLQGLTVTLDAATFSVGDFWVIRVSAARPSVRVTDTAGIDSSVTVTIADSSTQVPLGDLGGTVVFGAASLVKGDLFYVEAAGTTHGAYQILTLADNLPDEIVAGLAVGTVDDASTENDTVANSAPSLLALELDLRQDGVQITSHRTQDAPAYNWQAEDDTATVFGSMQVQDSTWTDVSGNMLWLDVVSANLFLEYRALLQAYADGSLYEFTSLADVMSELGAIDVDNPLALAAYRAMQNSGGRPVSVMGIATDDLAGYNAAYDLLTLTSNVYAIVPATSDPEVIAATATHVSAMSVETQKRWRIAMVGATVESAVAVLDSTTNGGDHWVGTVTIDPASASEAVTIVDIAGAPALLTTAKAGDKVRVQFATDAWGDTTYGEYTVKKVLTNNRLKLASGPAVEISVAARIEIWHGRSTAERAAAIAAQSAAFANRRVYNVFPTVFYTGGVAQPSWVGAAAIAGLSSSVVPQQGLTSVELAGFDDLPEAYRTYTTAQLNQMAGSGTMIVTQDTRGGVCYIRHQVSTRALSGNLYYTELSITRNLDAISYFIAERMEAYKGRYNVTPQLIMVIRTQLKAVLDYLGSNQVAVGLLGPMLILTNDKTRVVSVEQDGNSADTLTADVDLELPAPLNNLVVRLHVVI